MEETRRGSLLTPLCNLQDVNRLHNVFFNTFQDIRTRGLILKPEERNWGRIKRCLTFYSRPYLCKPMDRTNLTRLEELSVAARRGIYAQ